MRAMSNLLIAVLAPPLATMNLLSAGCATQDEHLANIDFGNSVRHTIALQTDNAAHAGAGLDAQKAQNVLAAYRQDVSQQKQADKPIVIGVTR